MIVYNLTFAKNSLMQQNSLRRVGLEKLPSKLKLEGFIKFDNRFNAKTSFLKEKARVIPSHYYDFVFRTFTAPNKPLYRMLNISNERNRPHINSHNMENHTLDDRFNKLHYTCKKE